MTSLPYIFHSSSHATGQIQRAAVSPKASPSSPFLNYAEKRDENLTYTVSDYVYHLQNHLCK